MCPVIDLTNIGLKYRHTRKRELTLLLHEVTAFQQLFAGKGKNISIELQ